MRRGGAHYGSDSGGGGSSIHQQQQNNKSVPCYQGGRHQDKDHNQNQNQWRWEGGIDGGPQSKLPPQTPISPTPPFTQVQGRETPRSYYQNQRMDPQMPLEKQRGGDPRSQTQEEDMDLGYEDNHMMQTFEGLEKRFVDEIMRLSKEQTDAEDTENARHRERINTINKQYEEQLIALRARHASRREKFLRRESQARQQQYQQIAMEQQYANGGISLDSDPHPPRGYNSAPSGEPY